MGVFLRGWRKNHEGERSLFAYFARSRTKYNFKKCPARPTCKWFRKRFGLPNVKSQRFVREFYAFVGPKQRVFIANTAYSFLFLIKLIIV